MKKNLTLILSVVVGLFVIILICMGVFMFKYATSDANAVANLVNTGNTYLNEQRYVEAVEQYEQALEYEPENTDLKQAIVKAYIMQAYSCGSSDRAIEYYEKVITYDSMNRTAYWAIANIYEERGEEDTMMDVLRNGYSATHDESMNTKVVNIETERARIAEEEARLVAEEAERLAIEEARADLLRPLMECFAKGDLDDVKMMMRQDDYISLSDEVIGDVSFYYGDKDANGNREGTGIAVYENGYYYYGSFSGNCRSGHGIWMRAVYAEASSIGSFIYDGEWENDMPNGEGESTSNFYSGKISSSELVRSVIKGHYNNGLEEGKMVLTGTTKSGSSVKYEYSVEGGVAAQSSKESSGVKGQYIIAKSSDGKTNLTSDGSKRGVEGFLEE